MFKKAPVAYSFLVLLLLFLVPVTRLHAQPAASSPNSADTSGGDKATSDADIENDTDIENDADIDSDDDSDGHCGSHHHGGNSVTGTDPEPPGEPDGWRG